MRLTVEIEKHSGFCGGVINAIGKAEKFLSGGRTLYSLGAIVHNEAELERLENKGLKTIGLEDLRNIPSPRSETVFIRAHGEPPKTYSLLKEVGINVIDCTCPVVLKLQRIIRETYSRIHPLGGQVIIFGKIGHAEVLGLVGQTDGHAIVIEDMAMLSRLIDEGSIDLEHPLAIFSQTTKDPEEYRMICDRLLGLAKAGLEIHDTICSQVAMRHKELSEFAVSHDAIIFVSGSSSSNGKVLFTLCKSKNPRAHHISSPDELQAGWFREGDRVGICGATSTPRWLLERTAEAIERL